MRQEEGYSVLLESSQDSLPQEVTCHFLFHWQWAVPGSWSTLAPAGSHGPREEGILSGPPAPLLCSLGPACGKELLASSPASRCFGLRIVGLLSAPRSDNITIIFLPFLGKTKVATVTANMRA